MESKSSTTSPAQAKVDIAQFIASANEHFSLVGEQYAALASALNVINARLSAMETLINSNLAAKRTIAVKSKKAPVEDVAPVCCSPKTDEEEGDAEVVAKEPKTTTSKVMTTTAPPAVDDKKIKTVNVFFKWAITNNYANILSEPCVAEGMEKAIGAYLATNNSVDISVDPTKYYAGVSTKLWESFPARGDARRKISSIFAEYKKDSDAC